MKVDAYFTTDCGRVREVNEDAGGIFINKANQVLAIVADGMGGHQAGEVASELAVVITKEKWEQTEKITKPTDAEEWLLATMLEINKYIYQRSLEKEIYHGMGTTVVLSICTEEFVTIAHVGDSRCYLLNDTNFEQITVDHSLVNELIRTGQISEVDAEQHPRKNVLLKAVGTEATVKADVKTIGWNEEHRLLLCSDGLTNKVTDLELEHALRQMENIHETAQSLVELANERGGEDNITLAIVRHQLDDEVGDASC